MDFKYMLLGIILLIIIGMFYIFWPILDSKYKLHKNLKEKKRRQVAFKNKMKELEIK